MKKIERIIARHLLQIKAIKLEPAKPFLWASGWYSPIYCDNRLILSFPEIRDLVRQSFCDIILKAYPSATLIAGVATGAIAHGALVADRLDLPFAYVRPSAKAHGLTNSVEGLVRTSDKVVVIEDLVSTGKSSLSAVQKLRASGCDIMGMLAIFSYGFDAATENFRNNSIRLESLTSYFVLLEVAEEMGIINNKQLDTLQEWRNNPSTWNG